MELLDLPRLTDFIIGSDEDDNNSYAFYCCRELAMESFHQLQSIEFGRYSFHLTIALKIAGMVYYTVNINYRSSQSLKLTI